MNIILILILMFYASALTSFILSAAAFSMAGRIRANFLILFAILAIFILSWIQLTI